MSTTPGAREPEQRSASVPLADFVRRHSPEVKDYGWIAAAAVLIVGLSAAHSAAAFGVAIGVGGVMLGLWGSLIAASAARDGKLLREAVKESGRLIEELGRSAANTERSAVRAEQTADRMFAFEELQRLRRVQGALNPLRRMALKLSPLPGGSPGPIKPIIFTGPEGRDHYDRLHEPLEEAYGTDLPLCRKLASELHPLSTFLQTPRIPPESIDRRASIEGAVRELDREMAARKRTLRRD